MRAVNARGGAEKASKLRYPRAFSVARSAFRLPRFFIMRLSFLLFALLLGALTARAHPVAQGAMDIVIHEDRVEIRARVANEQAFVAEALAPADGAANDSLDQLWQRHGKYLLAHVHVSADGAVLAGELAKVTPPENTALEGRIGYELRYPFPAGAAKPRKILIAEDVLNELEFAPGNRWEATYVVRLSQHGGQVHEGLLLSSREPLAHECDWSPAASSAPAGPPKLEQGKMFWSYLHHGVLHILTGYDHLLFMAALVLAVASLWDLIKVVTAFTLAHTITLTLSVLDLVRLPSHIVEPMIAASIVVVALQNIFWPRQTRGWARLAIAFGFGLFHGLGFAGGLLEAMEGLPGLAVATAIVAFSIGVELGHQVVVLPIFAGLQLARRAVPPREGRDVARYYALRFGSAAICLAGLFYFVAAVRAA